MWGIGIIIYLGCFLLGVYPVHDTIFTTKSKCFHQNETRLKKEGGWKGRDFLMITKKCLFLGNLSTEGEWGKKKLCPTSGTQLLSPWKGRRATMNPYLRHTKEESLLDGVENDLRCRVLWRYLREKNLIIFQPMCGERNTQVGQFKEDVSVCKTLTVVFLRGWVGTLLGEVKKGATLSQGRFGCSLGFWLCGSMMLFDHKVAGAFDNRVNTETRRPCFLLNVSQSSISHHWSARQNMHPVGVIPSDFSRCGHTLWAKTLRNLVPSVCLSTLRNLWVISRK